MKMRLGILAVLLLVTAPLFAQEAALAPMATAGLANLESGFPATVIDTVTTQQGELELGIAGAYLTNGETYETATLQASYGVLSNVQLTIGTTLIIGEGLVPGNGDTDVALLAALVEEDGNLPSLGLELSGRLPTGRGFTGYDGTIAGVLTKSMGEARVHVNASYTTIGDDTVGGTMMAPVHTRNDADAFVVGVDFPLTTDVVMIVDALSKEARTEGTDRVEMVEVGVRAALSEADILGAAIGVGIGNGNGTPDFAAVMSYQRAI